MGSHSPLQGIFPTQESNLGLLRYKQILYLLRHQGKFQVKDEALQSLSHVQLFSTPWTAALQASLSVTNSQSLLKLMSMESVMPSDHLILYHPLLLPPSIFPSIRIFSNEVVLRGRWPKYLSFSFSISPSNEYSGLVSFRMGWLDLLQSKGLSRVSTPQFKSINS